MIRLEELKKGDRVYAMFYDKEHSDVGIYSDIEVIRELSIIECPEPIEGVWCKGGMEILNRTHESLLFRTEEEREKEVNRIRSEIIANFKNNVYLKSKIYECATSGKRLNKYYRGLLKDILGLENV